MPRNLFSSFHPIHTFRIPSVHLNPILFAKILLKASTEFARKVGKVLNDKRLAGLQIEGRGFDLPLKVTILVFRLFFLFSFFFFLFYKNLCFENTFFEGKNFEP